MAGDTILGYMTEERAAMQRVARDFTFKEVSPIVNRLDPGKDDIPRGLRVMVGSYTAIKYCGAHSRTGRILSACLCRLHGPNGPDKRDSEHRGGDAEKRIAQGWFDNVRTFLKLDLVAHRV